MRPGRGLTAWRQHPDDQLRQDAFLADIQSHWRPTTSQERRLSMRASIVHGYLRLFGGPPSLAPAAIAGVLAALGAVLLPSAPAPVNPDYTLGPPAWAYLLIALSLIGLAFETLRSPREIQPRRYALLVALPMALGTLVVGFMLHVATAADEALRFGVPAFGLGVGVVVLCAAARRYTALRFALRATSVAFAVTAVGQFDWAWMYGDSGYGLLAMASAFTATGAVFTSVGFARAQLTPFYSSNPRENAASRS
ncbi:hypothetical protein acdb102_37080 [Acidothermaceae bacterium B102]|nr:hypothetical protein acdb102_37080 [Acidothermaceae bacterium B102]